MSNSHNTKTSYGMVETSFKIAFWFIVITYLIFAKIFGVI